MDSNINISLRSNQSSHVGVHQQLQVSQQDLDQQLAINIKKQAGEQQPVQLQQVDERAAAAKERAVSAAGVNFYNAVFGPVDNGFSFASRLLNLIASKPDAMGKGVPKDGDFVANVTHVVRKELGVSAELASEVADYVKGTV